MRKAEYMTTAAFPEPNYTQTPNDFFVMLPDMGDAELRVTLVMIRQTFGFHREGFKMGVTKLADAAGLSRQGALDGAKAAEGRGTFRRTNPEAQGEAEWELVVALQSVDPSNELMPPLKPVEGGPQVGGGQVGVKERINKVIKEREKTALDFDSMTIPQARKVPTLRMYYEAAGWFPADVLWKEVHEYITKNNLTAEKIRAAAVAWVGRGYKRGNVMGILEWAANGIPGSNGQKAPVQPAIDPMDRFAALVPLMEKREARS